MPGTVQSPPAISFGRFKLDLTSGELREDGQNVALPPKAFAVLKALVERPGEVVTREDLRARLWAADTFVEFEDSLNHAVNKLRHALGDSAEAPRFIETLPRFGYRFIVQKVEEPTGGASTLEIAVEPSRRLEEPPTSAVQRGPMKRRRIWVALSFAVLVLLILITGVFMHKQRAQAVTEKDIVVLADFANKTSDPVFTGTLRQGLLVQMSQSPFFNFLPASQMNATLQYMGHDPQDPLTDDLARQLCQRNQGKAYIAGSIATLGTQYVLDLKAVNCSTGDVLAQQQTQVARKEDVIRALGEQATLLRGKLGESLGSIRKFDVPLEQATTTSLEALQAYTVGMGHLIRSDSQSAMIPFQRAIELDPEFAMAYLRLGSAYGNLGQTGLMEENIGNAYSLRSRSTEAEDLRIEAAYYMNVNGDLYKAIEAYKLIQSVYPQADYPHNLLGAIYRDLGQYDEALLEDQEYHRRRPSGMSLGNLAGDLINLGRLEEAEKLLAEHEALHLNRQLLLPQYYSLGFLRHDSQQMQKIAMSAAGDPGMERQLLAVQADTEAYQGRFKRSREFRQQAVEACLSHSLIESAAAQLSAAALQEADVGNFKEAQQLAARSLKLARTRRVLAAAAIAYAQSGNIHQAQTLADDLGRRYPFHTLANLSWIPTIRASIANQQGDPSRAVETLQRAVAVELGNPNGEMDDGLELRPVYTRGQAYLRVHRGTEAAAEFRKIIDHPGLIGGNAVAGNTVGVLAHLGLARAYVLQGDNAKAHAEYKQFLNLWKDADPDVPIFQQAKTEYAALQ